MRALKQNERIASLAPLREIFNFLKKDVAHLLYILTKRDDYDTPHYTLFQQGKGLKSIGAPTAI